MQNVPPYARWAFSVHDLPRHDESVTQLLETMVARAGFGLVLVTADRKVIYANDSAKLFMQREVGLRCRKRMLCFLRTLGQLLNRLAHLYSVRFSHAAILCGVA